MSQWLMDISFRRLRRPSMDAAMLSANSDAVTVAWESRIVQRSLAM